MQIKIKHGLDIPMKGKPEGGIQVMDDPKRIALHVSLFHDVKFKVLVKVGDPVKVSQPILVDKLSPKRHFLSPAGGVVKEIRRGLKRRLLSVVIERSDNEDHHKRDPIDPLTLSRDDLVTWLGEAGCFAHIRMRPFDQLAKLDQVPRAIFVNCVTSAPCLPAAEMQVEGFESFFQTGLKTLGQLTEGKVHLVHREGSPLTAFFQAEGVERHTISGPHPTGNTSVHIHHIDPIRALTDVTWTLNAYDVVTIGRMVQTGEMHTEQVIGIGGEGVLPDRRGYFRVRRGAPIEELIKDRNDRGSLRFISGDPLMGEGVEVDDFLGFNHFAFTVLKNPTKRQFLHFFRPGFGKYTATRAYATGHMLGKRTYSFTTSQHGEERAFIDGRIYDKVMPMRLSTMLLVKAVIGRDYEQAEHLGLLEVAAEDFALPTFICPSKIEMVDILKEGLDFFASEVLA